MESVYYILMGGGIIYIVYGIILTFFNGNHSRAVCCFLLAISLFLCVLVLHEAIVDEYAIVICDNVPVYSEIPEEML